MSASPFDRLERELVDAARRKTRKRRRFTWFPFTVAPVLVCAGAAAGYAAIGAAGIAPTRSDAQPKEQRVATGSATLLSLRAADPKGGLPWGIRLARSQTGLICSAVGQVKASTLGIVGLDDRFRALPDTNDAACGQDGGADQLSLLATRVFSAKSYDGVRTVISGVAGTGLRSVDVTIRGHTTRVPHSDQGAFVLAAVGFPEDLFAAVTLRWADGRTEHERIATGENLVMDSLDGPAWTLRHRFVSRSVLRRGSRTIVVPRLLCLGVKGARNTPASGFACARNRETAAFDYFGARFHLSQRAFGRTFVFGQDQPSVRAITVTAPGVRQTTRPRSTGEYLFVLPPRVDPATVRVAVTHHNGRVTRSGPQTGVVSTRSK